MNTKRNTFWICLRQFKESKLLVLSDQQQTSSNQAHFSTLFSSNDSVSTYPLKVN